MYLQLLTSHPAPLPAKSNAIGSVSYTHLDVYKRQVLDIEKEKAIDLAAFEKLTNEKDLYSIHLSLIHILLPVHFEQYLNVNSGFDNSVLPHI